MRLASSGLWLALFAACGPSVRAPVDIPLRRPSPLPAPATLDARARGAAYLTSLAAQLQPQWAQFLEDCRLRLPTSHPLNAPALVARAELVIDRGGRLRVIGVGTSGLADFDLAVRQVLADSPKVAAPPAELLSDDDKLHLRWLFARDRRQAGPATAEIVAVELPVLAVTERLLAAGDLARAARRVAAAKEPERDQAAELVMTAALREALGSTGAAARTIAVEAVGRAGVHALAGPVRMFLGPTVDTDLRFAAITAAAALGDATSIPILARQLRADLESYPRLALAETAALVELGARDLASAAIGKALDADPRTPNASALAAYAVAPDASHAVSLATWFGSGDARTRAAVCTAVPPDAPAPAFVARGLRDPDATVRATCIDASARHGRAGASPATLRRLRELALDRDRIVRARAVAALAALASLASGDTYRGLRATLDPAPEVRAASVPGATEAELRTLASDPDADVRAAAISALADRAPDVIARAATDVAPQVRRAAVTAVADTDALARLARDAAPDVATSALIALVHRRGRAAETPALLADLAAAPPGSAERVRIALAWLLAGP